MEVKPRQSWMVTPRCYVGGLCVKDDHLLHSLGCQRVDDGMPKKTWKCFGIGTRAWNSSRVFQRTSSTSTSFQPQEHKQADERHGQRHPLRSQSLSHSRWAVSGLIENIPVCTGLWVSPTALARKTTWLLFWDMLRKKEKTEIKRNVWSLAITSDCSHPSLVVFSPSTINTTPAAMQAGHKRGSSVKCQCDLDSGYWEGLCYNLPYRGLKKEPVF